MLLNSSHANISTPEESTSGTPEPAAILDLDGRLDLFDFEIVDRLTSEPLALDVAASNPSFALLQGAASSAFGDGVTVECDDIPIRSNIISIDLRYEKKGDKGILNSPVYEVETNMAIYKLILPSSAYSRAFAPFSCLLTAIDLSLSAVSCGADMSLRRLISKMKKLGCDLLDVLDDLEKELDWLITKLEEPFQSRLQKLSVISDIKTTPRHARSKPSRRLAHTTVRDDNMPEETFQVT
jgi:hypothetical protein